MVWTSPALKTSTEWKPIVISNSSRVMIWSVFHWTNIENSVNPFKLTSISGDSNDYRRDSDRSMTPWRDRATYRTMEDIRDRNPSRCFLSSSMCSTYILVAARMSAWFAWRKPVKCNQMNREMRSSFQVNIRTCLRRWNGSSKEMDPRKLSEGSQ